MLLLLVILLLVGSIQADLTNVDTLETASSAEAAGTEGMSEDLTDPGERMLEELLDAGNALFGERSEDVGEIAEAHESLHELASWKLDLNLADEDELLTVPGLAPMEAARLLAYRREKGRLVSLSELKNVGLTPQTIEAIRPFVHIDTHRRIPVRLELVQRWTRRLTSVVGYRPDATRSRYAGTPDALFTRARVQVGRRLTLGTVLEKDPGEVLRFSAREWGFGFDHASGYVVIDDLAPFRRIIVGDFTATAGRGLAFGQSVGMRSSEWFRNRTLLRPHSSAREFGYFRGAAVQTTSWHGLSIAGLISTRMVDAAFDSAAGLWSFSSAGLHRTVSERSRRRKARESAAGWALAYRDGRFRAGMVGSRTTRSIGLVLLEEYSSIAGSATWWGRILVLSTEVASRNSALSIAAAIRYEPSPTVRLWLQSLETGPRGGAPHSFIGVDSQGAGRRESTWYGGIEVRPSERWAATLSSRWRDQPEHPIEDDSFQLTASLEGRTASWFTMRAQITDEQIGTTGRCAVDTRLVRCGVRNHRRSIRMHVQYLHSPFLRNRLRAEFSNGKGWTGSRHSGFVLYKDVRWQPISALQLDARLLFFDVGDFSARIYAFENDVLYAFNAPVYTGRGRRWYLLARINLRASMSLQVKYGNTSFEDVGNVGSGLEATVGPTRRDVRVQIRWRIN